ncbi:ABC transporter permease subunit [Streptomyces sp. NPDC048442]|uniref:ABC transporter permease n=1 Tax=Streptomyces sp. NPDC048442 TaxID=3154823 RepID=UPI00341C5917
MKASPHDSPGTRTRTPEENPETRSRTPDAGSTPPPRRPLRRILGAVGVLPGLAVGLVAVVGPWVVGPDPEWISAEPYAAARAGLLLGADESGRDVAARLLAGGRELVLVPVIATLLTAVLGTLLGMLAGYLGGRLNTAIGQLNALFLALPPVLVLLVLLNGWGNSPLTLIAVVAVVGVPFVARVAAASTAQVRENSYVEQAAGLGESTASVLLRDVLPNIVRPVLADAGTRLAIAITLTASAGFLGFGSAAPHWGAMISQNMQGISLNPWGVLAPAVLLSVLTVSANRLLDRLSARIGQ